MKVSVIIPAYNEEEVIAETIEYIVDQLGGLKLEFEVIVGDDGSTDNTLFIVSEMEKKLGCLKVVRNVENGGRGSILKKAFEVAEGDLQIYVDADLRVSSTSLKDMIRILRNESEIVVGTKYGGNSNFPHPKYRRLLGLCYSHLTNLLLSVKLSDCQCGFKGFRRKTLEILLPETKDDGWFWDTEVLVKARWRGYSIKEIPLNVLEARKRKSRIKLKNEPVAMMKKLMSLRTEIKKLDPKP